MSVPQSLAEIDWQSWDPVWRATLLFIFRGDEVLLIEKKTGFGQGKVNAPGGRLEPGETPLEAAIREVQEEVCVTPTGIEFCGDLYFQFIDGLSIRGHVYRADGFEGTPAETVEALPFWHPVADMPYDRMWADDRHWVPLMMERKPFVARFLFDDETMLEQHIEVSGE